MKLINNMPFVDGSHLPPAVDYAVVAKPVFINPAEMHPLEKAGRGIISSAEHGGKGVVMSLVEAAGHIR